MEPTVTGKSEVPGILPPLIIVLNNRFFFPFILIRFFLEFLFVFISFIIQDWFANRGLAYIRINIAHINFVIKGFIYMYPFAIFPFKGFIVPIRYHGPCIFWFIIF